MDVDWTWKDELEFLITEKHVTNPYALMSIIQYKGIHKLDKDWRKVILKEISRLKQGDE
jgi:hypothetical protein